jgi:hemerythrin superfamily protein
MTTATQQKDVVDVLLAQHERLRAMFGEVCAASGKQKQDLFEDLVRLLAVHEAAEEELVHPLSRRDNAAGNTVVDARLAEEQQAKRDLADLYRMGTGDPGFDAGYQRLQRAVLAHAEHEEHEEFPALRRAVPTGQLSRLAGRVLTAEKLAPTRPHPRSPSSGIGNLIVGPPLAVFDRIRDAIRDLGDGHRP